MSNRFFGRYSLSLLTCHSLIVLGPRGCDRGGVCASDAYPVRAEEHADCEWAAAAGGAGGGAGFPGAGAEPLGCRQRRPAPAVHAPPYLFSVSETTATVSNNIRIFLQQYSALVFLSQSDKSLHA